MSLLSLTIYHQTKLIEANYLAVTTGTGICLLLLSRGQSSQSSTQSLLILPGTVLCFSQPFQSCSDGVR